MLRGSGRHMLYMVPLIIIILCLHVWRWWDNRLALRVWENLQTGAGLEDMVFTPDMVSALPDPARRFFLYTIKSGTPLRTVVEIEMEGEFSLGTREKPDYMPMRGIQILAYPKGFVWKFNTGSGLMKFSGAEGVDDTRSWLSVWALGMLPVARAGGSSDHYRSAFCRLVTEATLWSPAAMLPQNGVVWEAVSENVARATVSYKGMSQSVELSVNEDGQPLKIVAPRWSNVNPEKKFKVQPFGGYVSEFREFEGYMLATRVEAGNFIGTPEYFPFYKAKVKNFRFNYNH